jgi:hypothetical protein
MPVRSIVLVMALLAGTAMAQTQNPSQAVYLSGLTQAMRSIRGQVAGTPQPKIMVTAQHLPTNLFWVNVGNGMCNPAAAYGAANACTWNNLTAMNNYTDGLKRAGVGAIEMNIDIGMLAAAPYVAYHGYTTPYTGAIPNDCPAGWRCRTLPNYDAAIEHAVAAGIKVRLRPRMDQDTALCGWGSSATEAQFESCALPLYVAAVSRWDRISTA